MQASRTAKQKFKLQEPSQSHTRCKVIFFRHFYENKCILYDVNYGKYKSNCMKYMKQIKNPRNIARGQPERGKQR